MHSPLGEALTDPKVVDRPRQPAGSPVELLERDAQINQLRAAYAQVQEGTAGGCALVCGEAGIGKTALVQAFLATLTPETQPLVAGCEALFTPRPFGPLVDLADRFPPSVSSALHQGRTDNNLFPALLAYFKQAKVAPVLVIEDAHWADAGTLDFVRHAGRRLRDTRLLLVLTYRNDEFEADHALRRVLGDLPSATTLRMAVPPLSAQAVSVLAKVSNRAAQRLYEATGGNPFYLTEALASPGSDVPPSVSDAVLARLARLPPTARAVAELVSLCPARAERALLQAVAQPQPQDLDACLGVGLLEAAGDTLAFRHELARMAVYQSLRPHQREAWHGAIFAALKTLTAQPTSLARLVHHAEAASMNNEVAELAPLAAREAASTGAHREAARLYGLALKLGSQADPAVRADLLEARAHECLLTNLHDRAMRARLEALALRRAMGNTLAVGVNLRWLARLHWLLGGANAAAFQHAEQAIAALEQLPPQRELAAAYSTLSHLHLVGENMVAAQRWGARAIALAESLGDPEALSHALNNVGSARLRLGRDEQGWQMLERSLALALEHQLEPDAARAYNNLFIVSVMQRDHQRGLAYAEQGIAYSEAKGIDIFTVRMRIRRAFAYLQLGLWAQADQDLAALDARHTPAPMEQATLQFVRSILALRRGQAGAEPQLMAALADMERYRVEIWFTSTAAVRAEVAWLHGDPDGVVLAVEPALAQAVAMNDPWRCAELSAWLGRARHPVPPAPGRVETAYALEAAGDWRAAAAEWARLGCPYERALALAQGGEPALREALVILEGLGANATAECVRRLLHELGAKGVPRGPREQTRGDPLGLTAREREVFALVLKGLSNAAIAAHLHRSERTVENHVARVLAKAGAGTRTQLIATVAAEDAAARRRPQNRY
ncbi:MAG: AAA family ATPase [Vitreoscilla sp.]|nr:AAA family ATPase [Vitreoscilla sp.]